MSDQDQKMTRHDYQELAKFIRAQERVLKTTAKQREAELLADFERQLATVYKRDDERWATITEAADKAIAAADAKIALLCREQGILEQFRPKLDLSWYGRGENAFKERRAELRRVAERWIAAMGQRAKAEIERRSLDSQQRLLAGGLESEAARALLESLPTVEDLMPKLSLARIEAAKPLLSGRERIQELMARTSSAELGEELSEFLAGMEQE